MNELTCKIGDLRLQNERQKLQLEVDIQQALLQQHQHLRAKITDLEGIISGILNEYYQFWLIMILISDKAHEIHVGELKRAAVEERYAIIEANLSETRKLSQNMEWSMRDEQNILKSKYFLRTPCLVRVPILITG